MTDLLQDALDLWRECPSFLPPFSRTFSPSEQSEREAELDRFIASIQAEFQRIPRTRADRDAARSRITAAFAHFGRTASGLDHSHLDLLLNDGFSAIGTLMAREARRFDPAVSTDDIFQASRNAWTACGLQMLLGQAMRLTPAIFAYSMLYPYTDNYLDDPDTLREDKAGFNIRFGRRLAGYPVTPANSHETAIWKLIAMIEGQYARASWPEVYGSLLAIHRAQVDSIRLHRQGNASGPVDVLSLSFAKGGASVLADGYLAAGSLSPAEAQFVFCWGVLLQLADDLQDVRQDRADGVLTLFTTTAASESLDALTNRTLHFASAVLSRMNGLGRAECKPLQQLIARSSTSLLIRAAGEAGSLYTSEYTAELERHSPFRFAFLEDRRTRMARHTGLMARLFEAFLAGDEDEPAFPLLPSSLMPRF